jgi:hypothetical protein
VWFSDDQPRGELVAARRQHVDAAGVERAQRGASLDDMQRRAPLAAGLGQRERAAVELEEGERVARRRLALREPEQAAGDHQVDHDEEVAVERDHDALADPLDALHRAPAGRCDRRHAVRSRNGLSSRTASSRWPDDARREAVDVDRDVGQLGHRGSVPSGPRQGPRRSRPRSTRLAGCGLMRWRHPDR